MTADDDKRALERFVAGLDVGEDALAAAVTARAVDRTVVVEALLAALASPQPAVRRRAAQRVARMSDVAPRIAAELTLIAGADPDERTREAGVAALRAHRLLESDGPPDAPDPRIASAPRSLGERLLASLWLQPLTTRSDQHVVLFLPRIRSQAQSMRGRLLTGEDGGLLLELSGLPPEFAGSRPTVRVRRDARTGAYSAIGTAAEPVSADGAATIRIAPEIGPTAEVRRWFEREIEIVATGP